MDQWKDIMIKPMVDIDTRRCAPTNFKQVTKIVESHGTFGE